VVRAGASSAAAALIFAVAGCGETMSPEEIVRGWNEAVNEGDNDRAAEYFAAGATIVVDDQSVKLAGRADARRFNASLPCAADIAEIRTDGDRVTATFNLRQRYSFRVCSALPDPREA
jgi:SnoaL-like domain